MMKRFLLCVVLAASLSGCRIFGERRPTPDTCKDPGPVPTAPPVTQLPPGTPPPPGASHVVVALCQATGGFHAAGVNVTNRSFTYLVSGNRASRETFLANAYRAGVPVVLYTAPVKVRGVKRSGGSAATTSGAVASTPETGSGDDGTLDPCFDSNEIGDEPPNPKTDPGNAVADPVDAFARLAWSSAGAIDGVSDPGAAPSTPPPGTSVPR
jgi:hypothetical protein